MEALIFIYLLFLAGLIVLMWFIAKWFAEIAADKGYYDKKYFWICFWPRRRTGSPAKLWMWP